MSGDRFNEYCENLLVQYKRRNATTVTRRLESLNSCKTRAAFNGLFCIGD